MSMEKLDQLMRKAEGQSTSNDFREFWETIAQINELIKSSRLIQQSYREVRDWQNGICSRVKNQMETNQRARKEDSAGKRRLVEVTISKAISAC